MYTCNMLLFFLSKTRTTVYICVRDVTLWAALGHLVFKFHTEVSRRAYLLPRECNTRLTLIPLVCNMSGARDMPTLKRIRVLQLAGIDSHGRGIAKELARRTRIVRGVEKEWVAVEPDTHRAVVLLERHGSAEVCAQPAVGVAVDFCPWGTVLEHLFVCVCCVRACVNMCEGVCVCVCVLVCLCVWQLFVAVPTARCVRTVSYVHREEQLCHIASRWHYYMYIYIYIAVYIHA